MQNQDTVASPEKGIKVGDSIFIHEVQQGCDMEFLIGTVQKVYRILPDRFGDEHEFDGGYGIQTQETFHLFREDQVDLVTEDDLLVNREIVIKKEIKKLQEETEKTVLKIKNLVKELQEVQSKIQAKQEKA